MKIIQPLFFFIIALNVSAQNLVLNPSFEDYQDCPRNISFFHLNVKDWTIPNNGTTDYFNLCSNKMGFDNFMGNQKARNGKGYAGIHVYFKKNYREYIQGELISILERGKRYEITFYVSLAEKSTHAIKDISLQFYNQKVLNYSKENLERSIFKTPIIRNTALLSNSQNWIELKAIYKAVGFENYFIIGNFDKNSRIEKERIPNSKGKSKSYYYIDDVSIEPIEKEDIKEAVEVSEELEMKTNEIYTFKNVLFDFNKAELLEVSIEELNQLYIYLSENSSLSIEIYGHTDNVGLNLRNTKLSEQRAKAVADYLILQGLDVSKIKSFGFGSSKPISDNETEEGRQKNRRVEFKLIEI